MRYRIEFVVNLPDETPSNEVVPWARFYLGENGELKDQDVPHLKDVDLVSIGAELGSVYVRRLG